MNKSVADLLMGVTDDKPPQAFVVNLLRLLVDEARAAELCAAADVAAMEGRFVLLAERNVPEPICNDPRAEILAKQRRAASRAAQQLAYLERALEWAEQPEGVRVVRVRGGEAKS
jgi:hypothetical protein